MNKESRNEYLDSEYDKDIIDWVPDESEIEELIIKYLESDVETDDINEEIEIESAEEDTSDSVRPRDELDS